MNKINKMEYVFWRAMAVLCIGMLSPIAMAVEQDFPSKWTSLGTANFKKGTKLPMYGISVQNPMEEGELNDFLDCHKESKACTFNFSIPDAQKDHLQLVQIPDIGVVLVPSEWHEVYAASGVDGSTAFTFYSQKIEMRLLRLSLRILMRGLVSAVRIRVLPNILTMRFVRLRKIISGPSLTPKTCI